MNDPLLPPHQNPEIETPPGASGQLPAHDDPTIIANDFDTITDLTHEPPDQEKTDAAPLVLVHYRSRLGIGLILISLLLGGETAYLLSRTSNSDRPRPTGEASKPPASPLSLSQKADQLAKARATKPSLVIEVKPLPLPPETAEPAPDDRLADNAPNDSDPAAEAPPETELAQHEPADKKNQEPPAAVGFDRPGTVPPPPLPGTEDEDPANQAGNGTLLADATGAVPLIPPQDDTQLAIEAIQRAALEKRAERQDMIDARSKQAEIERKRNALAAQARARQEPLKAQAEASKREAFRAELQQIIQQGGPATGEHILALARRYNVEPSPAMEQSVAKDLKGRSRTYATDRSRRVALLRGHGLSEPTILGDLIVLELQALAGRQGSRSQDLAIVRAARQLLSVPPNITAVATAVAPPTQGPSRTGRFP